MEKKYETPDLSFAAFLKLKGFKLIEIGKILNSAKFKFIFDADRSEIENLKVDYLNSESYQFDLHARSLRAMVKNGMK